MSGNLAGLSVHSKRGRVHIDRSVGVLPARTYRVHIVAHLTDLVNGLIVRRVTDVRETDLIVLPIETSGACLVGELVPMRSDDIRMLHGGLHIAVVHIRPLVLVAGVDKSRVEHSTVHSPEMELAYHHRLVDALRQREVVQIRTIDVVTQDITVLSGDVQHVGVRTGETASKIEHIRSHLLEHSPDSAEIGLDDLHIELFQIFLRRSGNPVPVLKQSVPRGE